MRNNRRNDLDIITDILRITDVETKITHIVYGANLNFNLARKYTSGMIEDGLLEEVREGNPKPKNLYIRTKKGEHLLEEYTDFLERYGL